jgi:hydroxyacylglutathione hydrolase
VPERILITHADGDHIGGLDAIADRYDAEVWISEESEFDTKTVPDHRYTDGDTVFGFVALHIPGHKQDSYAFVHEERDIAIMGDVLFGSDHRALPTGYLIRPPAVNSIDVNQVEENLEKLLDYEFDVALVFHGSSVTEDASRKLHDYIAFPGSRIEHPSSN